MEKAGNFSHTDGPEPTDGIETYPSPPFPAWVPAVTVAVSMLIFLAGSFYFRHRKVIKKRQIFMDYFYIIFQYGGMRRKRMVAALCNTNAITLRELGRSFMISFDSFANAENSCPFYPDESAFTGRQNSPIIPAAQKKSFFRNRGMTMMKKYRGPFIRINTQPDENVQQGPASFQDIVMKFKGRRPHSNVASAQSTPNRRGVLSPQYEGSSMCTIHGDDYDYQKQTEDEELPVNYNRQRRNAYVFQYDALTSRGHEGAPDVGRHSLGHIMPDHFRGQPSPYSGKRNSEPFPHLHDHNCEHSHGQCQQSCVFEVPGDLLSPANVVCGSHGFIPIAHEQSSPGQQYRNSEPTILIHSPSTDGETPQGWNDIRSRNTNGIVFLKRVPRTDGAPGMFYYEEERTPSPDRAGRASLSKVSYVPSGNMNEYYNCFHSTIKQNKSKEDMANEKNTGKIKSPKPHHVLSKSKRSRLSMGDLAISNFNRRIDFSSQSLQDQDSDQPTDSKESQDSSRSRTTWTRLKNVFSGSRAAQTLHNQVKVTKSIPSKQDRQRRKHNRRSTSWQKFVSVLTGFRSLPETKKSTSDDIPRSSISLPLGLDMQISKCDENLYTFDLESDTDNLYSENIRPWISDSSRNSESQGTDRSTYERVSSSEDTDKALKGCKRLTTLNMPVKTNSFPEELIHGRRYFKRVKTVLDASKIIQNKISQPSTTFVRRYRKKNDKAVASSLSLPQSKKDFSCYVFQAAYSPSRDEYRFVSCSESNDGKNSSIAPNMVKGEDLETPSHSRCFGSLSPLPERLHARLRDGRPAILKSETDFGSNKSLYWTPPEKNKTFIFPGMETGDNGELIVSEDLLQSLGHQNCTANIASFKSNSHIDLLTSLNPLETNDLISVPIRGGQLQHSDFDDLSKLKSTLAKQQEKDNEKSQTINNSNTLLEIVETFPQPCFLTLEPRLGLSNETLYYDTVSALQSPSPSENMHFLDVERSSSDFFLNSTGPECVSHQELGVRTETIEGFPLESRQRILDASRDRIVSNTSSFHKNSSYKTICDKTEPTCTQSISRVQSTPLLSVGSLWEKSTLKRQVLLTYCSSHLSDDRTSTTMPVFGSHQSQCLFFPAQKSCGHEHSYMEGHSSSIFQPTMPARRHSSPGPLHNKTIQNRSRYINPEKVQKAKAERVSHGEFSNNSPLPHCVVLNERRQTDTSNDQAGCSKFEQEITTLTFLPTARTTTRKETEVVDGSVYVNISPYDALI